MAIKASHNQRGLAFSDVLAAQADEPEVLVVQQLNAAGAVVSPDQVEGKVASGATDSGNPIKVGGVYNTAPAVATAGQRRDFELDAQGNLRVQLVATAVTGADAVSNAALGGPLGLGAHTAILRPVVTANFNFNGASWDRQRKANLVKRIASSAASGNPDFLKAAAGELKQFWGQNGGAITYLQFYNKTSAPAIGTDTPILTFPIAANERFVVSLPQDGGLYFSTGVAFAFTTDAAGTTGAAAAAVTATAIIGS